MENKYYKPSIEEFHVGFQYEANIHATDQWIPFTFEPNNFSNSFDFNSDKGYSVSNAFRVKYLDRQDIEDLGWRVSGDQFSKNGFYLKMSSENWVTIYEDKGADEYAFRGTIRNKSELARIMKMLKIE